jgi:3-hydroxyisobutyrate dehydrogenase
MLDAPVSGGPHGAAAGTLSVIVGGPDDISFKDQELETAFAKRLGVPLFLANVSQQVYQMGRAAGFSKEDGSSLVKVYEALAGVKVSGGEGG